MITKNYNRYINSIVFFILASRMKSCYTKAFIGRSTLFIKTYIPKYDNRISLGMSSIRATGNNSSSSSYQKKEGNKKNGLGRSRYNKSGTSNYDNKPKDFNKKSKDRNQTQREHDVVCCLPSTSGKLLYFTCKNKYEETLMKELHRDAYIFYHGKDPSMSHPIIPNEDNTIISTSSPYPGLVRVEDFNKVLPPTYDPVYALQSLPNVVVVHGESIKSISRNIYSSLLGDDVQSQIQDHYLQLRQELLSAPRGSLAIHGLVPGMCKGQLNPTQLDRSQKIAKDLTDSFRKVFPAARKRSSNISSNDKEADDSSKDRWILQLMLQSPSVAIASLVKCHHVGPGNDSYWPNWNYALGLAQVDIADVMPSSAYRKLMEAFECMRIIPSPSSIVYDLGASPGGWTAVLRRLQCTVVSVDRSPLNDALMKDPMVSFVKGDAFTFVPEPFDEKNQNTKDHQPPNNWMISDIIAYPERATELLDRWCGGRWVKYLIVTMKFQGDEPSFSEITKAIKVANSHGYQCRSKHFFNNKNEVTLMAWYCGKVEEQGGYLDLNVGVLGNHMYPVLLPG